MKRQKPTFPLTGLGDLVAIITYYTYLDVLAHWFAVKILKRSDCGCTRRKKTLNKWFKFK